MEGNMKELFKNYLINQGYKEFTPSGNPSTVFDYAKRIEKVIYWEHYDGWDDVAKNINKLCVEYSEFGSKADLGATSHYSVINALRRFKEFLEDNNRI